MSTSASTRRRAGTQDFLPHSQTANYVNVIDPRKDKQQSRLGTFAGGLMHAIEKNKLEDMYRKVVLSKELPMLRDLKAAINNIYLSKDEPFGLVRLIDINTEGTFRHLLNIIARSVLIQRLTDQNFIRLSKTNTWKAPVDFQVFLKEYIPLSVEEAKERMSEARARKVVVFIEMGGERSCDIVGVEPEGTFGDVSENR
jgi:hypothetical protein